MEQQSFANHTRRVPVFLAAGLILVVTLIGAGVNLYQSLGDHQRLYSASLLLVLTACVLVIGFYARTFSLIVQDRAIRAEENLRHYVLTGSLLDGRLTPHQIVALRFASDAEFAALARQAAEKNMEPRAIKEAVKSWRADHHRA